MKTEIDRKIGRVKNKLEELNAHHEKLGGPMNLTYHGGYDKGYLEGKLAALEDIKDLLEGQS
jgi:hypothetical protein